MDVERVKPILFRSPHKGDTRKVPIPHSVAYKVDPYQETEKQSFIAQYENRVNNLEKTFNDKKERYVNALNNYKREAFYVREKHAQLDDRFFTLIGGATNSCLKERTLDEREKIALQMFADPIDDISYDEQLTEIIESDLQKYMNELGEDMNQKVEEQLTNEFHEIEEIERDNIQRKQEQERRRVQLRSELAFPPPKDGNLKDLVGITHHPKTDRNFEKESVASRFEEVMSKYKKIEEEFDEIERLHQTNLKEKKNSKRSFQDKNQRIQEMITQYGEFENALYEYQEELDIVQNLREDLYAIQNEKNKAQAELRKKGYTYELMTAPKEKIQEFQQKCVDRENQLNENRHKIEEKKQAIQRTKAQIADLVQQVDNYSTIVFSLEGEVDGVKDQTERAEEEGNKLSCELYGNKTTASSSNPLTKIQMLRKSLKTLVADSSDDEYIHTVSSQ